MPGPTVYIPNVNGGERLLRALESLAAQTVPARTVVVDNGSRDGSPALVRARFPDVEVIELGANLGFGRAVNEAVRRVPGDPVVFVNNDCVCDERMMEALLAQAGGGASVAGVLLDGSDRDRIECAGVEVDVTLLSLEYLQGQPSGAAAGTPPPLGPSGGCALYPLEAFTEVGGFDERIFAYLEDVDLALRLAAAGHPARLAADGRAVHAHSATLGSGSSAKNELMGFARGYMLGRYRVLDSLGRTARALVCDATICAGQAVVDRTLAGVGARRRGYRIGRRLPARPVPDGALTSAGTIEVLRRRSLRRRHGRPGESLSD
jgi:hypothetical protein